MGGGKGVQGPNLFDLKVGNRRRGKGFGGDVGKKGSGAGFVFFVLQLSHPDDKSG